MRSTDRPIFLVGCPRSGTTLLSAMLHAHPHIAMPPETRFLLPVYRHRLEFGDLADERNRRRLAERITGKGTKFGDLGLDRESVVEQIVAGAPTLGSAAGAVWRAFARSRGKSRWGEKRPAYWRDMYLIMRLFPTAQVIHLVRDGRACVASAKKVSWWQTGVLGAMANWTLADRELRRFAGRLPRNTYHRVRYEDLLADPRRELGRLCAFLGERFDEAMLDHTSAAQDIVPPRKRWHARTRADLDPSRIAAWRQGLTPREIGLFEAVAARTLRRNGYELSGAGVAPSARDRLDYRREWGRQLALIHKERASDAVLRRRHPQDVSDRSWATDRAPIGAVRTAARPPPPPSAAEPE